MPYSAEHKQKTRERIVECARIRFNRHGFEGVTIEMVMADAGLTRGGFYNHFKSKEELFAAAVAGFLMGRGAKWRAAAGVDPANPAPQMAAQMIAGYLSPEHLGDLDGQCPMIALPSDVSRGSPEVKDAYEQLLTAMAGLFETSLQQQEPAEARRKALVLSALCVGGMVLARTVPDSKIGEDARKAAHDEAQRIVAGAL